MGQTTQEGHALAAALRELALLAAIWCWRSVARTI